ncbi:MAG TPA: hypothetical protein VHO48_05640, partial [Anaerolineaceae bacterium]|nr:hypothetical protein [Anaerolineaceae bacterium]
GSWFYSVTDSEISTDFTWTTGDPMSFSYTITPKANHTYVSGCPWDADGVRFAVSLGAYTWDTRKVGEIDVTAWWYIDPANWVPIKDFEAFEWDSENTWVTDARDFDLCRTY